MTYEEIIAALDRLQEAKAKANSLNVGEVNALNVMEKAREIAPTLLELVQATVGGLELLLEEKASDAAKNS